MRTPRYGLGEVECAWCVVEMPIGDTGLGDGSVKAVAAMPDLDPAHVEAVARHLANDWNPDRDIILTAMFRDYAATILTSTDPAVHAALLAALVRAGMLEARS